MSKYTVELSKIEEIALSYNIKSIQEWIDNTCKERARKNIDELVHTCVELFLKFNEQIPSSKEEIIIKAKEKNWI